MCTLIAAPTAAQEQVREPGALKPWQDPEIADPGSRWARMAIKIDKRGRPCDCRVIASNIHSKDTRFRKCLGMARGWETGPALENGEAVESAVIRTLINPGRGTREAWSKTRKSARR